MELVIGIKKKFQKKFKKFKGTFRVIYDTGTITLY